MSVALRAARGGAAGAITSRASTIDEEGGATMDVSERRRFLHGLGWGVVATAAMGATTLLMIGIGLWPLGRPLSMVVAEEFLPAGATLAWVIVAVVAVQLCYGA